MLGSRSKAEAQANDTENETRATAGARRFRKEKKNFLFGLGHVVLHEWKENRVTFCTLRGAILIGVGVFVIILCNAVIEVVAAEE